MIVIDKALRALETEGEHIRVGLVGPGNMGRAITRQLVRHARGMRLVAIAARSPLLAAKAYADAGVSRSRLVIDMADLDESIRNGIPTVTDRWQLLCESDELDLIVDSTGDVAFGAELALAAIANGKSVVLNNAELDATLGPLLRFKARDARCMIATCDGDQPGAELNLYRFVAGTGLRPILCGNIKTLYDQYRTPTTQNAYAAEWHQNPAMATSFADGTKLSLEQAVVANATGMGVARRGMTGAEVAPGTSLDNAIKALPLEDAARCGGFVDYVVGANPASGIFVVAETDDPFQMHHLSFYKMGDGPFYLFYTPYHLCHFEVPNTIARLALFDDSTDPAQTSHSVDVVAVAKQNLRAGATLDGIGGFSTYGVCENACTARAEGLLPIGVSAGCRLSRNIRRDDVLTYDDVECPNGRLIDQLRAEQDELFSEPCAIESRSSHPGAGAHEAVRSLHI